MAKYFKKQYRNYILPSESSWQEGISYFNDLPFFKTLLSLWSFFLKKCFQPSQYWAKFHFFQTESDFQKIIQSQGWQMRHSDPNSQQKYPNEAKHFLKADFKM